MIHFPPIVVILEVLAIDISLAGDNAIAIGMAAAGLPPAQRHMAIVRGIFIAAVLRILFAIFAVQLLHLVGLLVVGGLLLLWVAWKMYEEIRHYQRMRAHSGTAEGGGSAEAAAAPAKTLTIAVMQIAIADISMSLDNVLAVAGVARDHPGALVFGLALSVLLMGAAAAIVAQIISRHRWLSWVALAIVLYTALKMIWDGGQDVLRLASS